MPVERPHNYSPAQLPGSTLDLNVPTPTPRAESNNVPRTPSPTAPIGPKDIDAVVDAAVSAGLRHKVARLVPLGVIKGQQRTPAIRESNGCSPSTRRDRSRICPALKVSRPCWRPSGRTIMEAGTTL